MITDRDIAVRAVADAKDPKSTKVSQIMSTDVAWCFIDSSIDEVVRMMEERQVRRLPVVDYERKLVGVVALADLANAASQEQKATAVEGVSRPS